MTDLKKSPNWLLHGFILISLGIHFFIFLHVSGIYENRAISYIELSLQQTSRPNVRVIPKPRVREKPLAVSEVKPLQVKNLQVPRIKIDPVENLKDPRHEGPNLPQLPDDMDLSGFSATGFKLPGQMANIKTAMEFTTAKDYFEMLNLRIHSCKEYPESAKSRHLEGRVNIEFVLSEDGTLSEIKILKSSRHKNLDEAAIAAIKKAAPFPKPPAFLFKTPVTMRVSILFELA